jgi:hypothetical protein
MKEWSDPYWNMKYAPILLLLWSFQAFGSPSASISVSTVTNALNTPVVLDGSASTGASNYIWSQTAGATLDFVGQGMPKIMVISATNAGNYTFQLAVTDNSTYNTSSIVVTFIAATNHIIFVDTQLSANTATYSIANRNGSGANGNGFTNIQNGVGTAVAGDIVYIRGGLYSQGIVNGALINQYTVNVTNSGTATAPIRIENYPGEYVRISGWGFSDADTNSDGLADGVISNSNYRQTLFFISPGANYIQVGGLDLSNAQNNAMTVEGNYCYVREVSAHDNWFTGIAIAKDQLATNGTVHGDVLRYVEAYNNRHFTGILIGFQTQQTFGFMQDCAIVDSLSYWNGYKPNGVRVLPSGNDSQGGGNSGGFWTTKYFADNATFFPTNGIDNYGLYLYFIRDYAWNNSDDGFAFDHAHSLIAENRSLFNGPTGAMGYKCLRYVPSNTFRGNIAYGNQGRGFELRADMGSFIKVFNNTSVKNVGYGFWIAAVNATTSVLDTNNVAAFNGQTDWPNNWAPNWGADGVNVLAAYKGDPKFASTNITIPGTGSFTNGVTVKQKRDYLETLIAASLTPATNSPLLRAGVFLPSYHCPTADDDAVNPMPAAAIGRHWLTNLTRGVDMGALSLQSTNIAIPTPPAPTRAVYSMPFSH